MIELIVLIIIIIIVVISRAYAVPEDSARDMSDNVRIVPCLSELARPQSQHVPLFEIPRDSHSEEFSEGYNIHIPPIPIIIPALSSGVSLSAPSGKMSDKMSDVSSDKMSDKMSRAPYSPDKQNSKRVKFAPNITVRTFNINNGEIVDQHNRML